MEYTNSSLVSYTRPSPNHSGQRTHTIDTITIHCVVGQCSVETLGSIFAPVARQASANYGIGYDGRIGMYVEEKNRSWCSSSATNDHRAITIEVASDTTSPYKVNDQAYAALLDLVTDICKRNGITKLVWSTNKNDRINHLNGCNMTVHQDFAVTACPGDYLYNMQSQIAAEVNNRLGAGTINASPASGYITGTDTGRPTNALIKYTKGSTGTNQYGFEVGIDRNGIALADPVYGKGNMTVPAGGFVLSGHGERGKWLYGNIKQGYKVSVASNGKISVTAGKYRSIDGTDTGRPTDSLILYKSSKATGTNQYGWEVAIVGGVAQDRPIYGRGNMAVPTGGFVLSGHGEGGRWLYGSVKKGSKVTVTLPAGVVEVK